MMPSTNVSSMVVADISMLQPGSPLRHLRNVGLLFHIFYLGMLVSLGNQDSCSLEIQDSLENSGRYFLIRWAWAKLKLCPALHP